MSIKISVITICYNAADVIVPTIESVLAQDYADMEYIIQDGNSTDDTPALVDRYRAGFEAKNIRLIYNRENDGGIYDAMNKAVASVTGDYISFMNAGDCFYDGMVLSNIAKAADENSDPSGTPTIIYGDCAVSEYGRFYRFNKSLENIGESMPFSHQSAFAKSDFVRKHPFDTSYRYSADYDFLLTAYDLNEKFLDAGIIVCITTADGTSSVNYRDTLMESVRILKAHNRFRHSEKELKKKDRILRIKQFVLDHFPVCIKKKIRQHQITSRGQNMDITVPDWFYLTKK